jgi:hypothetical protein
MAHRNGDGVQTQGTPQGDPYDDKYRVKSEKPRNDEYEEENADGYEEEFVDFNQDDLEFEGGMQARNARQLPIRRRHQQQAALLHPGTRLHEEAARRVRYLRAREDLRKRRQRHRQVLQV